MKTSTRDKHHMPITMELIGTHAQVFRNADPCDRMDKDLTDEREIEAAKQAIHDADTVLFGQVMYGELPSEEPDELFEFITSPSQEVNYDVAEVNDE